jgi:hypothetical protein
MAVRLYPKEEVERELQNRDCEKVKEYGHTALWRTKTGFHFTVPLEGPDGRCDEYSLRDILQEIEPYS